MVWASKLQREIAASTTEADYNSLSESLRCGIHTKQIVDKIKTSGRKATKDAPRVHCKVFGDNIGALEMAVLPKMRPRMKHIRMRMNHFREHVRKELITIQGIASRYHLADIVTKSKLKALFVSQGVSLMQWEPLPLPKDALLLPGTPLRACEIMEQAERLNAMESQQANLPEDWKIPREAEAAILVLRQYHNTV